MAVSKTMWVKGIHIDAGKMRMNIGIERADRVRDVSSKWKEGFLFLKTENDRLQKENFEWYRREMSEIDAWVKQQIAQGPPAD